MKSVLFILLFIALTFVVSEAGSPLFKVFPQITPIYRGRADPIVSPGVFSGHVHRVFGGSAFSLGVNGRSNLDVYNDMMASSCTTASITVDKSAYWIPDLYYQFPNGTFTLVPTGGLTVYYFGRGGSGAQANPTFTAFPPGFRMLAGNPFRRSYSGSVPEQGISYACIGGGGPETPGFPTATRKCTNGLRAQVFFPMCWDGVRLDTPNHMDHVAYPSSYNFGNCPSSHPVRLPAIFYEVLYSVDQDKFPHGNGVQPFVWAMGDPTGYGLHGDFLNGWPVDILQAAMDHPSCDASNTNNGNIPRNCQPLTQYVKTDNPDQSCLLDAPIVNHEDIGINHWIDHLPGNNPVVPGPANAVPLSGSYAQTISPHVQRVLLKSVRNGLFVSSNAGRSTSPLTADTAQSQLSYPQVFNVINLGNNNFGIVTESSAKWVSNNGGGSPLTGDRGNPSGWEYWRVTYTGGSGPTLAGTIGNILALGNNKYVTVNANGQLQASSTTVGTNEQFLIIDANAGVPDTRPGAPTSAPTTKPATPAPTSKPTSAPTSKPATPAPTSKPTSAPTSKPATPAPTSKPATPAPTSKPATPAPTSKPATPAPTSKPATPAPTSKPTSAPTSKPATPAPTPKPTSKPTSAPTSPPSSSTPPSVAFIQNKQSGKFVVLGANNVLLASESANGTANVFFFSTAAGGYSIKARTNNLIVAANDGGASALSARSYTVSDWETFVITSPSSGFFALRAVNGKYVTAQTANTLIPTTTVAVGGVIPDAALFRLVAPSLPILTSVTPASGSVVKFFSKSTLTWITVDVYRNLQTLGDNKGQGASFRINSATGGFTLLHTATNKYTTADGGGSGPLMANRDTASGWETFTFTSRPGGFYTITSLANNQLVAAQNNDVWFQLSPSVSSSASPIPDSALFYIVAA